MNLDEAQRQKVAAWIADGAKLSEIQTRLMSEFGLKLTYMEVRFLVDDLKLTPKDPEPPKAVAPVAEARQTGRNEKRSATRRAGGCDRRRVRDGGSTGAARRDCQRQGCLQRRPAG